KDGLPDNGIRSVLETDVNGRKTLWIGTYGGGLARLQDDVWTVFNTDSGLPSNRIYDVAEVKFGETKQIWLATGGGAAYFDPTAESIKFNALTTGTRPALPNDFVYQILQ